MVHFESRIWKLDMAFGYHSKLGCLRLSPGFYQLGLEQSYSIRFDIDRGLGWTPSNFGFGSVMLVPFYVRAKRKVAFMRAKVRVPFRPGSKWLA